MINNSFFPTVIASDSNLELAVQMLPIAKKYLNDPARITNTWGYKNTYNGSAGIEHQSDLKPFIDYINSLGINYLDSLGYDSSKINFAINVFTSEMIDGDSHNIHSHPNCILSGIFYLQVPVGSSKIIFYDPRPAKNFVVLPKKKDDYFNWQEIYFEPVAGLCLIWQSWLEHSVPVNTNTEGRITLVFNITQI